jgi:hypothetical protein
MAQIPGSQSRDVMEWKRDQAQILLGRGLSVSQIAAQLRCSQTWVRRLSVEIQRHDSPPQLTEAAPWTGEDRRSGQDRRGHPFYAPRPT